MAAAGCLALVVADGFLAMLVELGLDDVAARSAPVKLVLDVGLVLGFWYDVIGS